MLLEVCIEPQHLPIILEPGRLDARNVVILRRAPLLREGQIVQGFGHLIDEVIIDLLFDKLTLLLLGPVHEIELLGFMIVLLIGIMEDVAWQEGHLFRNIGLHEVIFLY